MIRRFDREPVSGFVNPRNFLLPEGIELLTQSGTVLLVPYSEAKAVCFVRDFGIIEDDSGQKLFLTRPKVAGLWVRMKFSDGEVMDGLLPNNLLHLEPMGFTVIPPNPTSSSQRVFVPRNALVEFQVVGVIGSPLRRQKPKSAPDKQLEMFD